MEVLGTNPESSQRGTNTLRNSSFNSNRWPKRLPALTEEQERICEDFQKAWLEALVDRYTLVEKFNHTYPLRTLTPGIRRTLEIGAGRGRVFHRRRRL